MITLMNRRRLLAPLLAAAVLAACTATPTAGPPASSAASLPPVVFVHGNGDSAALWTTTVWRWESQGWPRGRLHAVNFAYPLARDDDAKPQEGRSSSSEQTQALAAEVDKVLAATGAAQVVLMGNSRGGNAIRSYIAYGGGATKVSHAILGGAPSHGIWVDPAFRPGSEFNGAGPFVTALNTAQGPNGDEVTSGPRWMTIRSDNNDKYAQPDGVWIGAKGRPTHIGFDAPALKGAENVVLPGRDHREVSYHAEAFAAAYRFVTGRASDGTAIRTEPRVVLDGQVSALGASGVTNLPLAGARVAVHAVDPGSGARGGAALIDRVVGADGRWGPLATEPTTALEFVVSAPGFATTHIYRSPFPRSSNLVHLRPERLAPADQEAAAVVMMTRPRGYFGVPRDSVLLDGQSATGIPPGVAGVASSKVKLSSGAGRAVTADYRSGAVAERIVGVAWPAQENHLTVIELHH